MANKLGKDFLEAVREIVSDCNKLPPSRRAHVTATSILCMIDGSGESDLNLKLISPDGEPVEFLHHELGEV